MPTERQTLFLTKRFSFNEEAIELYFKDLCSRKKVADLSRKYHVAPVQIQRDRNRFTSRKLTDEALKQIKNILDNKHKS